MARTVKKHEERREEIIQAARQLFQVKDYDKATMNDLIEVLNIAKGTLYHYFSSKEEILEAVVEDIVNEELRKKEQMLRSDSVKDLDAMEKLKLLITESDVDDENDNILDTLHHPENTEMHAKQLGRYLVMLAPLYARVISEGCETGVFKTEYPLECAEFILAGAQFLTDVGFYPWTDAQMARRMKALPSLLEAQLGARAGSFDFMLER